MFFPPTNVNQDINLKIPWRLEMSSLKINLIFFSPLIKLFEEGLNLPTKKKQKTTGTTLVILVNKCCKHF